jgi:hypothetical protein
MPYRPQEVERVLQQKLGFERAETRAVDHRSYQLKLPDMPIIVTKVSHGRTPIGPALEGLMARQMLIRAPFFRGVMNCRVL